MSNVATANHAIELTCEEAKELVTQLLETLTLVPYEDLVFVGHSHDYVGARIFGGQVLGQALMAASHTVASDKPCHSLHGYFLRGGDIQQPVYYQIEKMRDGRSLSARRVTARQADSHGTMQVIFTMMASFSPLEDGLDYQEPMPNYPLPDTLLTEQQLKDQVVGKIPDALKARYMRKRHVEIKPVQPRDPIHPEPMSPRQANWLRIPALGKQSLQVQQALLAFSSDFYLVGTGLMSHGISFMTKGLQAASIDHSMHFHRDFDLNDWLLYDMWSDTTSNAKGLNHGQFWQHGKLVATTQQEGLMRLR
ncbi:MULTISPECIES: acyl-CoA thioesterase [unclassified Moraxella]|uniref:acyl-CoA thioesterase n=1 Tax=unclassified Moraxella TaxID=2685852 RepID=UPI003AF4D830